MILRTKYRELTSRLGPRGQYWLKEWVEPIILAIILALIIRTFFFQAFKIPTGSMRPTLIERDRVLVNKILYKYKEPQRGDIIVFRRAWCALEIEARRRTRVATLSKPACSAR